MTGPPDRDKRLGAAWLVAHYGLSSVLPLTQISGLSGVTAQETGVPVRIYHPHYAVAPDPLAHILFHLRHELLRQDLLKAVFQSLGLETIRQAVLEHPYAPALARLGFYAERLTGQVMDCLGSQVARPTPVLDVKRYFTAAPIRHKRWHVVDNLPGSPGFCPLVQRTPSLDGQSALQAERAATLFQNVAPMIRERAAYSWALQETLASFAIEHAKPSPEKARRFVQVLAEAGSGTLSAERLCAVQRGIIDAPHLQAQDWVFRKQTVYVGESRFMRGECTGAHVHFIAPAPERVAGLMADWLAACERPAQDPIAHAAAMAFGLVLIHPFPDGNGRTHRFVLQHLLATGGLTAAGGITLPVSLYFERAPDRYRLALESFSKPLMQVVQYAVTERGALRIRNDMTDAYRYFDATPMAQVVSGALEAVTTEDVPHELRLLAQ